MSYGYGIGDFRPSRNSLGMCIVHTRTPLRISETTNAITRNATGMYECVGQIAHQVHGIRVGSGVKLASS